MEKKKRKGWNIINGTGVGTGQDTTKKSRERVVRTTG